MQRTVRVVALVFVLLSAVRPAFADLTTFVGATQTPSTRTVRGAALGLSLIIVGFEFEYADAPENQVTGTPSLRSGMFNMLVQTPFGFSGLQFYGTIGGGMYRERLDAHHETGVGGNIGGGVKMNLAGPFRMRLDYRLFTLRGSPFHNKPQRVYVGLNLAF